MWARLGTRGTSKGVDVAGHWFPVCPFKMFEFYERVSGARMHAAYVRPGGVHQVSGPVGARTRRGHWGAALACGKGRAVSTVSLASRTYPLGLWMTFMSFPRTSLFGLMSWKR